MRTASTKVVPSQINQIIFGFQSTLKVSQRPPIPSPLMAPPAGRTPDPPVDTKDQTLPFTQLTWINFERLIVRLIRRDHEIIDSYLYGTAGQAQQGIDILATTADSCTKPICIQCKNISTLKPITIKATVDQFLRGQWKSKVNRLILCLATPMRTTKQRDQVITQTTRLNKAGIKFQLWDGSPSSLLSEHLKKSPDLVNDFFGREWVRRFNGIEALENLGDRLSATEYQLLRSRLFNLYSTIFMQHDPGIHIDTKQSVDYQSRYIAVDIIEETKPTTTVEDVKEFSASDVTSDPQFLQRSIVDNTYAISQSRASRIQLHNLIPYESRLPVLSWLRPESSSLILGPAGYGKSMLLRYIALSILNPEEKHEDVIHPAYHSKLPIWISFARLTAAISESPHVSIEQFFELWLKQYSFSDVYPLFIRAVEQGDVVLLVDGLDESLSDIHGREAMDRLVTFTSSRNARIICTARPNLPDGIVPPSSWSRARLARFNDEQIIALAQRWFSIIESTSPPEDESANLVAQQVQHRAQTFLHAARDNRRTLELARTPLLCQVLIELFRFSHQLPEARTTAYQQILDLLLSTHPAARAQAGGGIINLPDVRTFDSEALKDVLVRLAATLQNDEYSDHLSVSQCRRICEDYLVDDSYGFGLQRADARRSARTIIADLHSRYGILIERAPREYNFVHLSIQEYLAAEDLSQRSFVEQIDCVSERWLSPSWRETLICWFGVIGHRRQIQLMTDAAHRIEELGNEGAWQRMHALELRADIATSNLRFPVAESRNIMADAFDAVEVSPFVEHRTSLARSLTIGALDSPVREECRAKLREWLPGLHWQKRHSLLRAFRHFRPSDDLLATLQRTIADENGDCRRASAEALTSLFPDCPSTFRFLRDAAIGHARSDVRASALHGLAANPKWIESAVEAAKTNSSTGSPELLVEVLSVMIQAGQHTLDDFHQLVQCWSSRVLDFRYDQEVPNLLCSGWPDDPDVRQLFVEVLERPSRNRVSYRNTESYLAMQYLVRCHPNDPDVACALARFLRKNDSLLLSPDHSIWEYMRGTFKGHPIIADALRTAIDTFYRQYQDTGSAFVPYVAPVYAVIGDDQSRDRLIDLYNQDSAFGGDRNCIASALFVGWPEDAVAHSQLSRWANSTPKLAAPLTDWRSQLMPDSGCREKWLRDLAGCSNETMDIGPLLALVNDFPDDRTRIKCLEIIDSGSLWYYHQIRLKSRFAGAFPTDPKSLIIVAESLEHIDGPDPGDFAVAFQSNLNIRQQLLSAACCTPVDVRLAIASVLRSRATHYSTVVHLTPGLLAEESGPVRATCLAARARASRENSSSSKEMEVMLSSELGALGMHMRLRGRTALSGLFELGLFREAASVLNRQDSLTVREVWNERMERDPVSIGALIQNWSRLEPYFRESNVDSGIPIDTLLFSGYADLLEQIPAGRDALDKYCRSDPPAAVTREYIEARSRRQLSRPEFRDFLIGLLTGGQSAGSMCAAARLLAQQFSEFPEIKVEIPKGIARHLHGVSGQLSGVLGYLCIAWPELLSLLDVKSMLFDNRGRMSARDRLLISVARSDADSAQNAAKEILSVLAHPWSLDVEDVHAMFVWFRSDLSRCVLKNWLVSDSPIESLAGLSFFGGSITDDIWREYDLGVRFNSHMSSDQSFPMDGLDPRSGLPTSWTIFGYSVLRSRRSV